jgi:adenine-specific DNA glycosylase
VKIGRKDPEHLAGTLVIARRNGKVLLWQRAAGARRMAGFWELPEPDHLPGLAIAGRVGRFRHTITHHHYEFTVVSGSVRRAPGGYRWVALNGLHSIPLSTTARKALALAGALPAGRNPLQP